VGSVSVKTAKAAYAAYGRHRKARALRAEEDEEEEEEEKPKGLVADEDARYQLPTSEEDEVAWPPKSRKTEPLPVDDEPPAPPRIILPSAPPEVEEKAAAKVRAKKDKAAAPLALAPPVDEEVTEPPPVGKPAPVETTEFSIPKSLANRGPEIVEPRAPPKPLPTNKPAAEFQMAAGKTGFHLPTVEEILEGETHSTRKIDRPALQATAEKLRQKLLDMGVSGEVTEIRPGPVVTMYEFKPAAGIKLSRIAALGDDLAMAMEALRVRIVAPIPGKGVVGFEVPNRTR